MRREIIAEASGLAELCALLVRFDSYALDTEFHREKTYFPQLALVQVAWPSGPGNAAGVAIVDPLAVDIAPLAAVLGSPGVMVAHAAEQDLEVLARACGRAPERLWDTQVAAGFAGHSSASLTTLSSAYLGITVAKGDRLTDWTRRPLEASQLTYAAADVDRLLDLGAAVAADLDARGRRSWAEDECALLLARSRRPPDPDRAWWRMRDGRQLRGSARGVAQELAAWRERRAQNLDVPVRTVLPDLALQSMAQRPPRNVAELREVRGLDARYLRAGVPEEILAALRVGHQLPPERIVSPPSDDVPRDLRPAVALAAAWVAQLARDEEIDAAMLATRADLAAFVRRDPGARLSEGWRAPLVGEPVARLLAGEAALAFAGNGQLVLEARCPQPATG